MSMAQFSHKIVVPQRPPYLVARPRLLELLGRIVDRRLITLSAPAGYGKTSLLTDFATTPTALPVCWYTLDRFDEDPWVFVAYLQAAVAQVFPGSTETAAALLRSPSRNPFSTVAAALVRDLYAIGQPFTIVIDDWHLVDHVAEITEVIAQVLLHCPNCHLILASRMYPSLPDMMLLAARRQMSGLDEDHLRFTASEIRDVLGAEYATAIPEDQAQVLAERSNGWITGVLLAVQASGHEAPSLVLGEARAERQIYRFLAEQVFERQPAGVRAFLLESALLEDLTPERCDEIFARGDSGLMHETLVRRHLFVSTIRPGVLRYHPLFREFLLDHFRAAEPRRYRETAKRVAAAYMAEGSWALAFDTCIAAGDVETAQRVVAAGGETLLLNGRLETLDRWFAALAFDDFPTPLLCLKARLLLERGQTREAEALAALAMARMGTGEHNLVLLLQAQINRMQGRYHEAIALARRIYGDEQTRDEAPPQLTSALRSAAICYHRLGETETAMCLLREGLAVERDRGDLYTTALLQQDLGVCYEARGELHRAAECYSVADAHWATIGNAGLRAVSLNCKGVVQHLMGHLIEAQATLEQARQFAEEACVPDYQATALASLGDLYSDLQLPARAGAAYAEARKLAGSAYLLGYLDLAEIRLLIRQQRPEQALRALERLPEVVRAQHGAPSLLLETAVTAALAPPERATEAAQRTVGTLERSGKPMELARAYLLLGQAAATGSPAYTPALLDALDHAAGIADELGYDAFLVCETLHLRQMLRRALAAGWVRAADWLQRQAELLLAAQRLEHDPAKPLLVVRTLGLDAITCDGRSLDLGWLKAREVFYYLLQHPGGASTEELRETIWPDLSATASRNALKTAIYQLRCSLPPHLIELRGRQVYAIERSAVEIDYDVERFVEALDRSADDPERIFEAIDLCRGDYLPWSDNGWSCRIRQELHDRFVTAIRQAAGRQEHVGAFLDALTFYRKLLALDILDEAAHAGVMRCQIALGNRAAAIGQYQALRRILDEELGLEPADGSEVEVLYHRILTAL